MQRDERIECDYIPCEPKVTKIKVEQQQHEIEALRTTQAQLREFL
jgi:hypothetical protein